MTQRSRPFLPNFLWIVRLVAVLVCAQTRLSALPQQNSEFDREFQAGISAAGQSDYLNAVQHFVKANELKQNKCSECYVWMARMDMGVGKFDLAIAQIDKAVATATTTPQKSSA